MFHSKANTLHTQYRTILGDLEIHFIEQFSLNVLTKWSHNIVLLQGQNLANGLSKTVIGHPYGMEIAHPSRHL